MKRTGIVLTIGVFLFIAVMEAWAQPKPIQFKNLDAPPAKPTKIIKRPPVIAQIKPGTIKINKLPPIQFKPFALQELRHPMTHPFKAGQPIHPDDEIPITHKIGLEVKTFKIKEMDQEVKTFKQEVKTFKIKGSDLLNEINKLEKEYNALGYTIRSPVKEIVIMEPIMKQDLLQRQIQNSKSKYTPLPRVKVMAPNFKSMQTKFALHLNQMDTIGKSLDDIQGSLKSIIKDPIHDAKSYVDFWGDRDFFAVGLSGSMNFSADDAMFLASAVGKVTGVVFNYEFDILRISGTAKAPTNSGGEMHAYLSVTALGDDLFTPINRRGKAPFPIVEEDLGIGVDQSVKIPTVALGPFNIIVTLGFEGGVGIKCGIYLGPGNLLAKFGPYVKARAYGQVGLNVWLLVSIEAGIGTSLTLLNDTLVLSAIAGIGFDKSPPYLFYEYYAQNTIDTLSGEIYAYVTVDYYIDSTTWKWTIFSWNGFQHDGYVIGPVYYNREIPPPIDPDAWSVTVYEHANYGGKSKPYTIFPGRCQAMEVHLPDIGMNDMISSVKVGRNVSVFLFEHNRYSGSSIRVDQSIPDLKILNFNDKTSSLIVFPKSMGHPVGVWLIGNNRTFRYVHDPEDHNFCSCKHGVTHHPRIPYNDDAIKVVIPAIYPQSPPWGNIEVELYEHESYQGRSVKFRAGPSGGEFTLPPELSRKVSSLRIFLNVNDPKRLQRPW